MKAKRKAKPKRAGAAPHELFKALSNELRLEILTILDERGMASPTEMAKETGGAVSTVSHHTKQLVKYGCAELVKTVPRRGAVEHYYRPTARPLLDTEAWAKMAPPARAAFSGQIAQKVLDDLVEGFAAGTVDKRTDRHMTRVVLSLDEQGVGEVLAIFMQAFDDALAVQAKSDERRGESGEEAAARLSVSQLCFDLPL